MNEIENRVFEEKLYGVVGTDDCHKVGIMGGCGLECWVYQEGRCAVPGELEDNLENYEDILNHKEL